MTLSQFFEAEGRGSAASMAKALECSKGYLSDIARGEKFPSRDFALRIEAYTGRKVTAAEALGVEAA
jgi:transcriptional regulator with XRE-family HTH domain